MTDDERVAAQQELSDKLMVEITELITKRTPAGGTTIAAAVVACCTVVVIIAGRIMPREDVPDFVAKLLSKCMQRVYTTEDKLKAEGELK